MNEACVKLAGHIAEGLMSASPIRRQTPTHSFALTHQLQSDNVPAASTHSTGKP